MRPSIFTNILEIVIIIGLIASSWCTASAVNRRDTKKSYLLGGITAALGLIEAVLVSLNCL